MTIEQIRSENRCAGPQNLLEECPDCEPEGTMGMVPVYDERYLGGFVDGNGMRHDPCRHQDGCPMVPWQKYRRRDG